MNNSTLIRLGFYAAVAVLVLAYVGLTSPPPVAKAVDAGGGNEAVAKARPLASRLGIAAGCLGLWMAVDLAVVGRLMSRDAITVHLVRVLIGWGALLALGAMLSAGNQRLLAAAIVFGVTAAFVGLWIAALASRKQPLRRDPPEPNRMDSLS
jgi:hypothetical protein